MGFSRKLKKSFLLEKEDASLIRELARRTVKRGMPIWGVTKQYTDAVMELALDEYGGSPTQIADALGIDKTWVCRYKKGRPNV